MSGLFITLEGPEGAGKSTQTKLLAEWLRGLGHEAVTTREPGGTKLGTEIRQLLLHQDTMTPEAEYLLYSADRAEHMATLIQPALERGAVVLCDRWLDSSLAYQGYGRGLNLDWLKAVAKGAIHGVRPDKTFLFDLPPEVGLARFQSRDRLEREPLEFHHKVRRGYLELAKAEPKRFYTVDGTLEPAAIQAELREVLGNLLRGSELQSQQKTF